MNNINKIEYILCGGSSSGDGNIFYEGRCIFRCLKCLTLFLDACVGVQSNRTVRISKINNFALIKHECLLAESVNDSHVMGNKQNCAAIFFCYLFHFAETLLLKLGVSYGENLVNQ